MKIDFITFRNQAWSNMTLCFSKIIKRIILALKHLDIAKLILFLLLFGSVIFAIFSDEQSKTSILVGSIAAWFAYLAYRNSLERLRLELLEKRWDIYQNTLKYCSLVSVLGGLKWTEDERRQNLLRDALAAADGSFRSTGYHKTRSLFGDDVNSIFSRLNRSHGFLIAFSDNESRQIYNNQTEYFQHLQEIIELTKDLPDIFRPYTYFGDYREDKWI